MAWISYLVFIILLFPLLSYGNMDDFTKSYLEELDISGASIFLSQCKSTTDGQYTATLIFEVGSTKGLLIEKKKMTVVNLATVILGNKGLVVEETHGGIYTYERVGKLLNELQGYKFSLLIPFSMRELETVRSFDMCVNSP
jgi:hypothetical protein